MYRTEIVGMKAFILFAGRDQIAKVGNAWSAVVPSRSASDHKRRLREFPRQLLCVGILLLSLVALMSGCSSKTDQAQGVQLILSTQELQPATTFELRFDEPMTPGGPLGAEAEVSPLVFNPKAAGHFVWTSPRSGIFTLDEPLLLGTEYELSLRPGLTRADGQPAALTLRRTISTPPFGVTTWHGPQASTNASSQPTFWLWFNADVRASAVTTRAGFLNDESKWIPAVAEQGTGAGWGWYSGGGASRTWQEMFDDQHRQQDRSNVGSTRFEDAATNLIPNLVVLTPAQPLSVGRHWRLVLNAKLPSTDGHLQTREKFEAQIGDVQEFALNAVSMNHVVNRQPFLELNFSKFVDRALTNSFTNWVQISPWPTQTVARVYGNQLSLEGGWQRGIRYQVTVRRGLPSEETFALAKPFAFTNEVPPVSPRLYFPEFSTEQFSGGSRSFPLLAVNVPQVSVKAKVLDAANAIHALRGFRSYYGGEGIANDRGDGFNRLDYNLIPGRTVFSQELDGTETEDVSTEIHLNWNELLNGRKAGIVFLQAERAEAVKDHKPVLGTQAIIQLTDLGLVWKSGGSNLQAFVFSYTTGQPVTNAQVRLYSDENELLAEAAADSSGLASLPQPERACWLAAQAGEDLHAVSLRVDNIPTWQLGVAWRFSASAEEDQNEARRVALFTDRDVYRPNESVNLKAVVRDLQERGLSIPAGRTGLVECVDAQGKHFFQTNFTLSALGSCATTIPLPAGPRGSYQLCLKLDGRDFNKPIQVADFQPPAFEIRVEPKASYGPADKIELPVSARYFFGKPLSRAQVKWFVEAADHPFRPEGFDDFSFERTWLESRWGRQSGNFAVNGQDKIQSGSNCVLRFDVPLNSQAPQPRAVSLLVEVTDLNQQTLTRSVDFVKHSSDFYLGLKQVERVLDPGKPLPVEIAAVGADGKPWRETVSAQVTLQRVEWQSVEVQGIGRGIRYRSEATLTNVAEKKISVSLPVKLADGEEGYRGSRIEDLIPPTGGEYLLVVTAQDAAGYEMASSIEFNVADKAELAWDFRNAVELKLTPDKASYTPGDTALMLVKAPFSGEAWVTVERNKVLRSFVTRLEGNAPAIRLPIEASDVPNVFVSVTLVRGAADSPHQAREPEYRVGYRQLKVESQTNQLVVRVSPDKTNCMPGELITVEARIHDAAGAPVPDAEVTLYAVDEGVLSLTDYVTPDLAATLLAPQKLEVAAGISLPFLMPEDPEKLTFQNKGYLGGGGGREHLRKRFLPCAFWNASLISDANGRVSAQFTAPDSLTRYRIIAVAHNARNQFGTGKSAFTVSKPLIIEPSLPQFANLTDRLQARAVVQNQTDQAGAVLVSLQLDDKVQAGTNLMGARAVTQSNIVTLFQTISVAAHGSATVEFPLVLAATGPAKWIWRARFADPSAGTNAFTDAVESSLSVGNITPLLHDVATLRLDSGQTNLLAAVNPQLLTGSGRIEVVVANTRMVALREAIQQLLHYPYGCVEQCSSSLLPWVVLQGTPALLAFTGRDGAEAAAAARSGIARLFSMQTSSGGLSYWPGGREPMLWGSAYGAFVLESARKADLPVPEKEFDSLLNYLSDQLRAPAKDDGDSYAQCLALYVLALAGRAEPAYHTQFYSQRDHLNAEERALLALAIATGEASPAPASSPASSSPAVLIRELLKPIPLSRSANPDPFGCPAREKAVRLLACTASPAAQSNAASLFAELQADQKYGHWYTTQGNAWALLAMRNYLRQTESGAEARGGSLAWAGEKQEFQLETNRGVFTTAFHFDASMSNLPLLLASPSGKSLYAQVSVESRLPGINAVRENHGFGLQRRYEKLNDDNEPEQFDHLRVGDRVLVTLRLAVPEPAQYVAVDDPLPGVFEALNSEFKTQQVAGKAQRAVWQGPGDFWWSSFHEIRADRVLFFSDHVAAGNYVIRYVARVRAAGSVTAPVAKVEEMYHPDRFGLSEPQPIICEAVE